MTELDKRRKQLLYRANHRGIKEMDIILGGFADQRIAGLDEAQLNELERLMELSDRQLLSWFTGELPVPAELSGTVVDAIFEHCNGLRR